MNTESKLIFNRKFRSLWAIPLSLVLVMLFSFSASAQNFQITDLTYGDVFAGETLVVELDVHNQGNDPGCGYVKLERDDGGWVEEDRHDFDEIEGGEKETVTLEWETTEDDVGDHDLKATIVCDEEVQDDEEFQVTVHETPTELTILVQSISFGRVFKGQTNITGDVTATVDGDEGATYTITLDPPDSIGLEQEGTTDSITASLEYPESRSLNGGTDSFDITVSIAEIPENIESGTYEGTATVTVSYND